MHFSDIYVDRFIDIYTVLLALGTNKTFFNISRGTREFDIFTSNEPTRWHLSQPAYSSELKDVTGKACDTELETHTLSLSSTDRYVLFVVRSFYGRGAGLHYLGLGHSGDPNGIEGPGRTTSKGQEVTEAPGAALNRLNLSNVAEPDYNY